MTIPLRAFVLGCIAVIGLSHPIPAQSMVKEEKVLVGDAPSDPGPLDHDLSPALNPAAVRVAMRKVADWQTSRIEATPSQDWTFATLYVGLMAAAQTLHDDRYKDVVFQVAQHYHWKPGPRVAHADDQAIGQAYLMLNRADQSPAHIAPLRMQFNELMQMPDDPKKPVWWWCDALFMAPPVWSQLASETGNDEYLRYMDHEWLITSSSLWDPQEQLFYRDASYLDKREKNGRKVFWSRGNGWVMGGLARVLETLPANDPQRAFYVDKLQRMAASISKIQSPDGLWRAGLLDAGDYELPETSGSAFFVYSLAWGINHHLLDRKRYLPVVQRGWAGLVAHVYESGRLGCVQPVGERPGAYAPSASSVFGTGAFLLAGSQVALLSQSMNPPSN
jgi:unsaturated rhamnogalacturonyl hydrolase